MTFPRHDQTEDWIKYLPAVPDMEELTICWWTTPFYISGYENPISYATSANPNTLLMEIYADKIKPVFNTWYTFTGVNFQVNQQVFN